MRKALTRLAALGTLSRGERDVAPSLLPRGLRPLIFYARRRSRRREEGARARRGRVKAGALAVALSIMAAAPAAAASRLEAPWPDPASVADINYGVRWAKANAGALKTRPDLVGLSGQSSGGHLAMLVAMRPHDPRYAAIALPPGSPVQDATVRCVVMSWPVINPYSRYRLAKRALAGADPPEWPRSIIARHDAYWRSEAEMAEGNPMLALERGEKVLTPPAAWFQGRGDVLHDYQDVESSFPGNEPQRFVANYRQAGGEITLEYVDMDRHAGHSPDLSKVGDMFERMAAFVGKHIIVER